MGKELANIIYDTSLDIEETYEFDIKGYCEPFCGMLGVYRHIHDLFINDNKYIQYKAGDANKSVILMWKKAQKGWKPPTSCSIQHYEKLKKQTKDSAEKGFIGHQYSFGGQYFIGHGAKYGNKTSYPEVSKRVSEMAKELKDVVFSDGDYKQFSKLKNYVIYCDPPYSNSYTFYTSEFDTNEFWIWCEEMSRNNIVFISEYTSPFKLKPVFQKSVGLVGNNGDRCSGITNRKRQEKLYVMY